MLTTIDKAIVAVLAPIASFLAIMGWDVGLTPDVIAAISSVISGGLVWLVPNKT